MFDKLQTNMLLHIISGEYTTRTRIDTYHYTLNIIISNKWKYTNNLFQTQWISELDSCSLGVTCYLQIEKELRQKLLTFDNQWWKISNFLRNNTYKHNFNNDTPYTFHRIQNSMSITNFKIVYILNLKMFLR